MSPWRVTHEPFFSLPAVTGLLCGSNDDDDEVGGGLGLKKSPAPDGYVLVR